MTDLEQLHKEEVEQERIKEEKKKVFRELVNFENSQEYKDLLKFCADKVEELKEQVNNTLQDDLVTKREPLYSEITLNVVEVWIIREVAETLKDWLFKEFLEQRAKALYSHWEFLIWRDLPMFTELDLLKKKRQTYWTIENIFWIYKEENNLLKDWEEKVN